MNHDFFLSSASHEEVYSRVHELKINFILQVPTTSSIFKLQNHFSWQQPHKYIDINLNMLWWGVDVVWNDFITAKSLEGKTYLIWSIIEGRSVTQFLNVLWFTQRINKFTSDSYTRILLTRGLGQLCFMI